MIRYEDEKVDKNVLIITVIVFVVLFAFGFGYMKYKANIETRENFIKAKDEFLKSNFEKADKLLQSNKPPKDIARDYYYLKSQVLFNQMAFNMAEKSCLDLIRFEPENAFNYYFLSLIYYNMGEHDKTQEALKKALSLNPNNIDYKLSLANLYSNMEKYDEAIKLYNEVKDADSSYEIAWASVASIYENKKDYKNALKYRLEAAKKFKDSAYDSYMLAKLYEDMNDKKSAIQWYKNTIDKDMWDNTDAKAKYYELSGQPYHKISGAKTISVPYTLESGLITIEASFNGKKGKFIVDTGATNCVLTGEFLKKINAKKLNTSAVGILADGSKVDMKLYSANLKIGGVDFGEVKVGIIENETFSKTYNDGIIGNLALFKKDYYLDTINHKIIIKI